mmetsp:Transcript_84059/g.235529  ORF Transcript_84059/g.235529 Transcript_84059/m.235529 type:complete len:99 (+) Transcript_84059:827-1123(+)
MLEEHKADMDRKLRIATVWVSALLTVVPVEYLQYTFEPEQVPGVRHSMATGAAARAALVQTAAGRGGGRPPRRRGTTGAPWLSGGRGSGGEGGTGGLQ